VDIDGSAIRVRRVSDDGYFEVEASLPAVMSVVEKINEPRYPSFKGIMAAKKKPVETFTIRSEGDGSGATLVLEWEKTRVRIPVQPS